MRPCSSGLAKILGAFVAISFVVPPVLFVSYIAAPRLEGLFFPILDARFVVDSVSRDANRICWDTSFTKLRTGTPAFISFEIVDGATRIPAAAYKIGGKPLSTFAFANHPKGASWTSRYCAGLPDPIKNDALSIEGYASYQVWHRLWDPEQILPTFEVPSN